MVRTGDAAPGTAATFSNLTTTLVSDNGQIAFLASLTGSGITTANNIGIWSGTPGSYGLVARYGNPAPGYANGVTVNGLYLNSYGNTGAVAFDGAVTGPGITTANMSAMWIGSSTGVAAIVRGDDQAPMLGTGVRISYDTHVKPIVNNAGQIAFATALVGTGVTTSNNFAMWAGTPGNWAVVGRTGDPAPGTPAGVTFTGFAPLVQNNGGQVAFIGSLSGPGITTSNGSGVWTGLPGNLSLAVQAGDAAPGTPTGVSLLGLNSVALNDVGQIAFRSDLIGTGVTTSNNQGIWVGTPGNLNLVARRGDDAPGTAVGVRFPNRVNAPRLNQSGQVVFLATLGGTGVTASNDTGIWAGGAGSLSLVTRKGDAAAGTGSGVLFGNFGTTSSPLVNGSGRVAFLAALTGTGVTTSNDGGLWTQDAQGLLQLIAREGDVFDVDPGPGVVNKTIQSLRLNAFTDLNEVIWGVTFTDTTTAIMLTPVPEPGTVLGIGASALALGGFVRRAWRKRAKAAEVVV